MEVAGQPVFRNREPLTPQLQPTSLTGDPTMSTIYVTTGFGPTATPTRRILRLFKAYWSMLREWQRRNALRGAMYDLSDRELQDIGTTRGEIEYVTRSRFVDPRGVRSA